MKDQQDKCSRTMNATDSSNALNDVAPEYMQPILVSDKLFAVRRLR